MRKQNFFLLCCTHSSWLHAKLHHNSASFSNFLAQLFHLFPSQVEKRQVSIFYYTPLKIIWGSRHGAFGIETLTNIPTFKNINNEVITLLPQGNQLRNKSTKRKGRYDGDHARSCFTTSTSSSASQPH